MSGRGKSAGALSETDRRRFLRLLGLGGLAGLVPPHVLLAMARPGVRFAATSTALFRQVAGGLRQMLVVEIPDRGYRHGALRFGGAEIAVRELLTAETASGCFAYVPLEPIEREGTADIAYTGPGGRLEGLAGLAPSRLWHIDVVHNSHQDPGYEGLPSQMRDSFPDYIDEALQYIDETAAFDADARFRWNVEVSYLLEDYRGARGPAMWERLASRLRDGSVELGALYGSVQTDALGDEVLRRLATHATAEIAAEFGIAVQGAILDDVPGFAWGMADALSAAGVRYLLWGGNPIRSSLHPGATPPLFRLQGPAGGELLVWRSRDYTEGVPLIDDSYDVGLAADPHLLVDALLGRYVRESYPLDRVLLQAAGDFTRPARRLSDVVRDWNARWAFPRLRITTMSGFFSAVAGDDRIPLFRGGFPDAWSDLRNTMPGEAAVARRLQDGLPAAEALTALAAAAGVLDASPALQIEDAYRRLLLFEEHTVGWEAGRHDIYRDESDGGGRQHHEQKVAHLRAAQQTATEVGATALAALAHAIADPEGRRFVVWNPLSWDRSGTVELSRADHRYLDEYPGNFTLRDVETGATLAHQPIGTEEERRVLVKMPPVPGVGYRTVEVSPAATPASGGGFSRDNWSIRNDFYELRVDPRTGAIASLVDLELDRELVDGSAPHGLNQLIQVLSRQISTIDFERLAELTPSGVRPANASAGPVMASLRYAASIDSLRVEQEIVLFGEDKRIDLITRMNKHPNYGKEALYLAFPFALEGRWEYARFRPPLEIDVAGGWMIPDRDQLPGSSRDYYVPRHAVLCSDGETALAWVSHDAPVIELGAINSNRLLSSLQSHGGENLIERAHLYSFLMHNHWYTNAPIAQGGEFTFRYSITSAATDEPRLATKRFGREIATPLVVAPCGGLADGLPVVARWLTVAAPNVAVGAVKVPWSRSGLVVRLTEETGVATRTRLTVAIPGKSVVAATECDLNENEIRTLVVNEAIEVSLGAFATVSILLDLA